MYDVRFPILIHKPLSAGDLARAVGGGAIVSGNAEILATNISPLSHAGDGSFTFCRTEGEAAVASVAAAKGSIVVLGFSTPPGGGQCLIQVVDPRGWYIDALNVLHSDEEQGVIHASADIADDAVLDCGVSVGAGTVISGGCKIGKNVKIGSGVYLGPGTVIGNASEIHPNAVVGAVGLGYHQRPDNSRILFPHLGRVIIGNNVSVGVNSCIIRGMIEHTVIGDRTTLGNFSNIGHNCCLGEDVSLSAKVVLTGGVVIENGARLAASVSVNSHVRIGENARVGMGSIVTKNIQPGVAVFGVPAKPLRTLRPF